MSYLIVIMTAPNKQEARKIVRTLLEERLIACANILDPVSSLFWWKGKIEEENEGLVFMKSHEKLFKKLSNDDRSTFISSIRVLNDVLGVVTN